MNRKHERPEEQRMGFGKVKHGDNHDNESES